MTMLDATALAQRLQARFGLGLSGGLEDIDGGTFVVLRPVDLPRPNGFGIVVARTPRQVEASFRADAFTRTLLRCMAEADETARATFSTLARKAASDGFRLNISVNGSPIDAADDLPHGEWAKFELDCDKRLISGKLPSDQSYSFVLEVASTCLSMALALLPLEDVIDTVSGFEIGLPEGAKVRVEVNKYERSPVNRAACIAHFGTTCNVCGFDFGAHYGDLGQDFIEVHHRVPVSSMGGEYRIDPVRDLVPVCGNCHAMLHRTNPPLSTDFLKTLIAEAMSK